MSRRVTCLTWAALLSPPENPVISSDAYGRHPLKKAAGQRDYQQGMFGFLSGEISLVSFSDVWEK